MSLNRADVAETSENGGGGDGDDGLGIIEKPQRASLLAEDPDRGQVPVRWKKEDVSSLPVFGLERGIFLAGGEVGAGFCDVRKFAVPHDPGTRILLCELLQERP